MKKSKNINIRLTEEQYNLLTVKADENNISLSDYVRNTLNNNNNDIGVKREIAKEISLMSNTINKLDLIENSSLCDISKELKKEVISICSIIQKQLRTLIRMIWL